MDDAMKQLNESFSMVLSVYFSYFQLEPIDVEITLAEKIANVYRQKRPDLFEGEHLINSEDIERNRGLTIPPKTIDEKFTIVINNQMKKSYPKIQICVCNIQPNIYLYRNN